MPVHRPPLKLLLHLLSILFIDSYRREPERSQALRIQNEGEVLEEQGSSEHLIIIFVLGGELQVRVGLLLLARFRGVVLLEVLDELRRDAFGVGHAEGLDHLVDLGVPGFRRKRRLHGDVARTVAGVAVGLG